MPRGGSKASIGNKRISSAPKTQKRETSTATRTQTKQQPQQQAPAPAPAPTPQAAPVPHAAPAQPAMPSMPAGAPMGAPSGGGGFFRRVAELGAGIAVGHVAGRALERMFFGGHPATEEQMEAAQEKILNSPCKVQYTTFLKCLENNQEDADKCDWSLDMFKECQKQNKLQLDEA